MNNVDQFIAYLSGEMSEREAGQLERKLAADPGLNKEFEAASQAYALIRDQLRKRDENAFKSRLLEVMERIDPDTVRHNSFRRSRTFYLIPLAGAVVLLLFLLWPGRNQDRLFSRFYHPEKDQVLLALSQVTRGGSELGAMLYHEGKFEECMEEMDSKLESEPENQLAVLYYLLASLETGMEDSGLQKYEQLKSRPRQEQDPPLIWYASLAMVKTGRMEEAAENLAMLTQVSGPYRSGAARLLKLMSK